MARKPSLLDAPEPRRRETPPAPAPAAPGRAPSRQGKRGVAFWLDPAAFRQLQRLSFEGERPIQSLMEESVDLLFAKHGMSRLAQGPTQ